MLTFDADTGFTVEETADVRERIADSFNEAFGGDLDTSTETPAGQLIDALTNEIVSKDAELAYTLNQFDPRTAEGVWQDALGYIYFLERKIAQPTYVTCQLTGLAGTVIPYGAIVEVDDDQATQLMCTAGVTIGSDGTAETIFRTGDTGATEIAAGTVTKIITVIAGWDTVNNEAAGATGRDVESRSEFEARRYASVAKNAHGSVSAILGELNDINDVIDCAVLENTGDDEIEEYGVTIAGHSIAVCVYGGEDEDIAEAIYCKKDAGCGTSGNTEVTYSPDGVLADYTYLIYRPETVSFDVQVNISDADSLSETTIQAIKDAVVNDFLGELDNERVGLASTVYASRFYTAVMSIEGTEQLSSIKIALDGGDWSDSVTINADQEPVMTDENVTVE